MQLISESINNLIEEVSRGRHLAASLSAVKQRFGFGKIKNPKLINAKIDNEKAKSEGRDKDIVPLKNIPEFVPFKGKVNRKFLVNNERYSPLKRLLIKSEPGRLYKYGKLQATHLKDKIGVLIPKIDYEKLAKDTTAKTGQTALDTVEGAANTIVRFAKGGYEGLKNADDGSKISGMVGGAIENVKPKTKKELKDTIKAAMFAQFVHGGPITKAAMGVGLGAFSIADSIQKQLNNQIKLSPEKLMAKIEEKVKADREKRAKNRADLSTQTDPKADDFRYGHIRTVAQRDIALAKGEKRNSAEEDIARDNRELAREAVKKEEKANYRSDDEKYYKPKSKVKAIPEPIDDIKINDDAIEQHKQNINRSKTQVERQEYDKQLVSKINMNMNNLTPEHKDYLRQTRISENINNLIEEVSQGYYDKAASKAIGQNIIKVIKHPLTSKNYQKLNRSFKTSIKYKSTPINQILSSVGNKLKTNIRDATIQTGRDVGDDIAAVATATGKIFGTKNLEDKDNSRAILGGARIATSILGGGPAIGAITAATAAYNLGK